jgi:hypothetical protein
VGSINRKSPGPIIMIDQSETLSRSQVQFSTLLFGGAQLCCAFYEPRQATRIWCRITNFLISTGTFWHFRNKWYCAGSHTEHRWTCSNYARLAQHYCTLSGGWWKAHQRCPFGEKSVINLIWLLITVSDWPITMIGPGGLLLVLPPPICCLSFGFRGGAEKK